MPAESARPERRATPRPPFLRQTAIAGVGFAPISRESGRSVLSLATEAAGRAIADAGLERDDVDGIASFSWQGDSVPCQAVASSLGLKSANYLFDTSLGGQAPCHLIAQAAMAVQAGLAEHVLVFRALNGRSGPRVGSRRSTQGASSYRQPIGLTAYPQVIAMWARRYMIETGATEDDLAAVPVAQRAFGQLNERAIQRKPLTLQDYYKSPMIADPFRAADCTTEVDGACAVLVTSRSAARSLSSSPITIRSAAYVSGRGSGFDTADGMQWKDYTRNYSSYLAGKLWRWAEMDPSEVDCAQIYDCFSSSVLLAIEGLGLAERGGAADLIRDGSLPINTNGGLLCEGYLHGMNTVAEAVAQLRGNSAGYHVPGAKTCVVTSGALTDGSALVLERE
jgi:acetyl-CoA acetyltransferase